MGTPPMPDGKVSLSRKGTNCAINQLMPFSQTVTNVVFEGKPAGTVMLLTRFSLTEVTLWAQTVRKKSVNVEGFLRNSGNNRYMGRKTMLTRRRYNGRRRTVRDRQSFARLPPNGILNQYYLMSAVRSYGEIPLFHRSKHGVAASS